MEDTELLEKIKQQQQKVANLNKFEERMHFLDDEEVIEMYHVIHNEERLLKLLQEKLKASEENKELENK